MPGYTIVRYDVTKHNTPQANDVVVTQESANPDWANINHLGNVFDNHSTVKSEKTVGKILENILKIK